MIRYIKIILKQITPPFLIFLFNKFRRNDAIYFDKTFSSWNESIEGIQGYESKEIFDKIYFASKNVKDGKAIFERDGICFTKEAFRWPVIANILYSIRKNNTSDFHILDFGGSLGSFYNQHLKFLSNFPGLKWNIVEQEHFVEVGIKEFQTENLKFFRTINECIDYSPPNLVLLSSVIQYLEDPFKVLDQLVNTKANTFIIDRTPFIKGKNDILMHQHLSKKMGGAIYPSWFFSEKKFLDYFAAKKFSVFLNFDCDEDFGVGTFKGIVLIKKNEFN